MKIGDIVTDFNGHKWIIYEMSDCKRYLYVTDFAHQLLNEYISTLIVIEVEEKPKNVSWLFLKRREENLKGLELYL
jgi:hypothetical protein